MASEAQRLVLETFASGVRGLDDVWGGGIPRYSFNVVAGAPGTGKTTLTQQILFANATPQRPGLFLTALGEPSLKMLRYQQQFRFFDPARVGADIHFRNLSEEVVQQDLEAVLERIAAELEQLNPGLVVVDSLRTITRAADGSRTSGMAIQNFMQRLALRLTSWEATSFLVGEFAGTEAHDAVFTVADGVVWLSNEVARHATVRKLRMTKVRGQAPAPGLHTMRITNAGIEVYPRQAGLAGTRTVPATRQRLSTGVAALDALMGGGIPAGDSVLVAGPTGSGKTILATQFIAEGVRQKERGVLAVFEEHPAPYLARAKALGFDLEAMLAAGDLDMIYLRPLDLSVDEALREIWERVQALGAKRVVVDSLSGFEAALSADFRQDFRESFYRLMVALTGLGVTILSTVEIREAMDYRQFSPYNLSFLTDDIIATRYVELDGELQNVLAVIKMRGSKHSRALCRYAVTESGLEIGERLSDYRGIITGVPERHRPVRARTRRPKKA